MPPSPFFSGASSSTAWNSSIPSTPVGPFTPYHMDSTATPSSPPPGFPNIGSMTLSSRYNTPRSIKAELPDVEEMQDGMSMSMKGRTGEEAGPSEVRIVGVDVKEAGKMEVDPV